VCGLHDVDMLHTCIMSVRTCSTLPLLLSKQWSCEW